MVPESKPDVLYSIFVYSIFVPALCSCSCDPEEYDMSATTPRDALRTVLPIAKIGRAHV